MKVMEKFFVCKHCGKMVGVIKDGGGTLVCCGLPMEYMEANVTDGAVEKHLPVVKKDGDKMTITIGAVDHPMTAEHYIEWIAVISNSSTRRFSLKPGDAPSVTICASDQCDVYAYCNLHGLWKVTI